MTATELALRMIPEPILTYARAIKVSGSVVSGTIDLLVASSPIIFQVVMVLAQSLQPGYNPLRDTISSMVWGSYGWLQTINFFIFGVLMIALVRKFITGMDKSVMPRFGGILLYLVGLGFIILAIFPTQSPGGVKTLQAVIHGITVYFITFLFPAACFLVAPALRKGRYPGFIFPYTIITGSLGLGLIVLGVFLKIIGAYWFGMLERVLLLNGFIWLEIVGIYYTGQEPASHNDCNTLSMISYK